MFAIKLTQPNFNHTTKVRYDDEAKRVVAEPVELIQEWRNFDATTPWESFPNFRETPPQVEAGGDGDSKEEKK